MELNKYLNKRVQIILINGFTYIGLIVDCDDDSLTLIDKNNSRVCLKEGSINFLKELQNGN
jgi:small nuclear ribonucleoprotein (snRNP)-like protein